VLELEECKARRVGDGRPGAHGDENPVRAHAGFRHVDREFEARLAETSTLAFRVAFAPELSERDVRADARLEKQSEFESTDTYRAVKRVYQARQGTTPAYARMPQVTLRSPKLSRERTTAWFAESVDRRFNACLARLPKDART
jgi:hypothetical protein